MQNKKRITNAANAIKEATQQMLNKDKNLVVMGEGVCDPKAIFDTTKDLQKKIWQIESD